jgi:hypothetical protein
MIEIKSQFLIGDIITLKTHPLFKSFRIKGDSKYVPPLMIVKEVIFESKKKKTFDEETGKEIAERIKYICCYFDDNKSEFNEVSLYEKMLRKFTELKLERINRDGTTTTGETLKKEVLEYDLPLYEFGKIVSFKTKKLEIFKKRSTKKIPLTNGKIIKDEIKEVIQYVVNYATPDFVICGYKKEIYKDLFYIDGKKKRLAPTDFLKVQWFNPIQQKFSEQYLPLEFFTEELDLNGKDSN